MAERETKGLAGGELSIDPSENVKALNEAASKRQDDLRDLSKELFHAEIRVLTATVEGVEKRMIMRAEHAKEIRLLEADRLEKIRLVDVSAIQTLAAQTAAERETLRNLVTTTASTIATQTTLEFAKIHGEIAALQKTSYEGAGKGTGAKNLWGVMAVGIGLLVTLFMSAITVGGVIVGIAYAIRP